MSTRTRTNLIVDAAVLSTYLLAANPAITGITAHEWVSVGFGLVALVHLGLHWRWVGRTLRGYLNRTPRRSRWLLALDAVTAAVTVLAGASGLALSRSVVPLLGLTAASSPLLVQAHAASAAALLGLAIVHSAVHWRWIVAATRLHVVAPLIARRRGPGSVTAGHRVAWAVPAVLAVGLLSLAVLGAGSATAAVAGNGSSSETCPATGCTSPSCHASSSGTAQSGSGYVTTGSDSAQTCPATGCTAASCHATSGRRGGGGRRGFGGTM